MRSVRRRFRHPSTILLTWSGRLFRPPLSVRSKPNFVAIFTSLRNGSSAPPTMVSLMYGAVHFSRVEERHTVAVCRTDDLDGVVDGRCRAVVCGQVHAAKSELRNFQRSKL